MHDSIVAGLEPSSGFPAFTGRTCWYCQTLVQGPEDASIISGPLHLVSQVARPIVRLFKPTVSVSDELAVNAFVCILAATRVVQVRAILI